MIDIKTDRDHIWHPFTPLSGGKENLLIKSAKGVWLETEDGRKILDAVSSWWVNIHGHGNEEIAVAVSRQVRELDHIIFAGFTHPPAIALTEKLLALLPDFTRIFFSDNGSTAVEVAIKMAVQYWYNQGVQKRKLIALEGAYHGDTFGAMSVGERSDFSAPFNRMLFNVEFLPFPEEGKESHCLEKMEELTRDKEFAAFIYEPLLQGTAGMRTYSAETLDKLMAIARDNELILIADEVLTGFGRTGKVFASDNCRQSPDLICLSKGLTGGILPLGLTVCNKQLEEKFKSPETTKTFYHGHSYTGNAISCAAAVASINLLTSATCKENIARISGKQKEFAEKIRHSKKVKRVSCLGTILAIEIETSEESGYFNQLRNQMYDFFLQKDILLRPLGNVIYLLPPYVIEDKELEKVYNSIEELLENL